MSYFSQMIVKAAITALLILVIYGYARPLVIYSYCKITVGTGGIDFNQLMDPYSSKNTQDILVKNCADQKMGSTSIHFLDETFSKLYSYTQK